MALNKVTEMRNILSCWGKTPPYKKLVPSLTAMIHNTYEYRVCSLDTQPLHILNSTAIRLVQSPDTSGQRLFIPNPKSCTLAVLAWTRSHLQPFYPPRHRPHQYRQHKIHVAHLATPRSQHLQRINSRRRPTTSHQLTPHPLKTSIYAPRTSPQTAAAPKEGPIPAPRRFVPDRHACLQNILTMPPISAVDRLDF